MENKNIFRNFGQSKVVFVVFMLIYNFLVSVVGDNCHEDMTEKRGGRMSQDEWNMIDL